MKLPVLATALFTVAALSVAAHADTTDNFSYTGLDVSGNSYTVAFSLDPASYATEPTTFSYSNVSGTVNGVDDTFTVNFTPYDGSGDANFESVNLFDSGSFSQYLEINSDSSVNPLDGDPTSGLPPTVTLGTYTGSNDSFCTASVRPPTRTLSLPPALAFFQISSPVTDCDSPITFSVTGSSTSVTPEPSTLALLATGALGIGGVLRRRFRA